MTVPLWSKVVAKCLKQNVGAGHSSGGRALDCIGWDQPLEPAWQVDLGYFPFQPMVHQRLWYVVSCLCERCI